MNKKEKIEHEIRKTLDQFDHAEQLPGDPYFSARVQSRLKGQRQQSIFPAIVRPALLLLFIVINVGTAIWYFNGREQNAKANARRELLQTFNSDFKLSANDRQSPNDVRQFTLEFLHAFQNPSSAMMKGFLF